MGQLQEQVNNTSNTLFSYFKQMFALPVWLTCLHDHNLCDSKHAGCQIKHF